MKAPELQTTLNEHSATFRKSFSPETERIRPGFTRWNLGGIAGGDRQGSVSIDPDGNVIVLGKNSYLIAWKVELSDSTPASVVLKSVEALYDWVHL